MVTKSITIVPGGNRSYSGWLGPYNSGAVAIAEHTWTIKGGYGIIVKVKDT